MSTRPLSRPTLEELESRTVPSASLVADINSGPNSSFPRGFANLNGTAFFAASDGTHGYELWKSDGTVAGTGLVKDINPGNGDSLHLLSFLTNVNGTLYFSADDGTHGDELWESDGTAAGTVMVKDINPGSSRSLPRYLTNVNGTLYFSALDGTHGYELWESDGTAAGTTLVKDIQPNSSYPRYLTNVNGTLFFEASGGNNLTQRGLWKSDGTVAGTTLVQGTVGGAYTSFAATHLTNMSGRLFFVGSQTDTNNYEVWESDGTAAGTVMVKDINPGSGSSPTSLTNVNGTLLFAASDGTTGAELWKSDGTAAGTTLVKDIRPGDLSSYARFLTNVNGTLFFQARDDSTGYELWKSDGSAAGTTLVKDLAPGGSSYPHYLTNVNGTLFFRSNGATSGYELWTSDGSGAGTTLVKDIYPGGNSSDLSNLVNVNGTLFFQANDGTHGQELWAVIGAGGTADTTGARITSAVFSGTATDTFDKVRITFSEAINPTSFTAADIGSFVEPVSGNAITITAITPVPGTQNQFDITFPTQTVLGKYSFTTSVDITDLAGNQMNQDGDASNGEDGQDQFIASATLGAPTVPPFFAVGNNGGTVRIVNSTTGAVISTIRPLDNGGVQYTGLVEVAVGDFNGDGVGDLVVSAADPSGIRGLAASKAGKVFVYDGAALATGTVPTSPFRTFTPFATSDGPAGNNGMFVNGLNIATGDVNGDGMVDLIAGTRGGNGTTSGLSEYGRLVVIDGTSPLGSNTVIGGIQKPFGSGYQKGVVVAAGNADGVVGDEIAVTRGGPVASANPTVQQIKVKVLQLQGSALSELHLSADGSTSFAPFGSLSGAANAIKRDGRVAFVDTNGDGKDELVFSALDPLTTPGSTQVRVGVFSINVGASTGAATIVSTGPDAGTYVTGKAVVDHAITHVAATGAQQNLAFITESASSGIVYLAPLTGATKPGGFSLNIVTGGITIDGI